MRRRTWKQAKRILADVFEFNAEERDNYVVTACAGDRRLLREVKSLLAADLSRLTSRLFPRSPGWTGTSIGRYEVISRLGSGASATVYLAKEPGYYNGFGRHVAIKVFRKRIGSAVRLETERRILTRMLSHPYIATLLDDGETPAGERYLVMEFVQGAHIDEHCVTRRLDRNSRLSLLVKVCDAVQDAHLNGVLHLDLKPSNILVTDSGLPRLLDFGISQIVDAEAQPARCRSATERFASPEQLQRGDVSPASDIFSIGMLALTILLRPARARRLSSRAVLGRDADFFRMAAEDTGDDLASVVFKALDGDPKQRYESSGHFSTALCAFLGLSVRKPPNRLYRTLGWLLGGPL